MAHAHSWGFRAGHPISSDLTVLRRLGGGSAYEVFLAFDEVGYTPVVVKVVRPHLVDDERTRRALTREVTALARVAHPSVVRALRHDVECDLPHVVLEHVEGPRLSSLVRRHGALQPHQYLPLVIDVAAALHYFRHVDLVHLDIKPSNIVMGSPAKLIDLSVARSTDRARRAELIGTDAWMAPEQVSIERFGEPGFACDVWGLGATAFHAVGGDRPFGPGDPEAPELAARFPQLDADPRPLPHGTPDEVVKVIHAALERDPANRPLPHEMVAALEPVVAALPGPRLTFRIRR